MAKRNLIQEYKKRWQKVKEAQDRQFRKLTIRNKLEQFLSLIDIAILLRLDFAESPGTQKARSRWAFLKNNML